MTRTVAKLNRLPGIKNFPPLGFAHRRRSRWRKLNPLARTIYVLQLKGFAGGVPLNTETAAVNPRAGIYQDRQEVFVLY